MKIGMNVNLDMANGWRVIVSGSYARSARNRTRSGAASIASTVTVFPAVKSWLEVSEGDENWHER